MYGRRIGTTCSTPWWPSRPSRCTCSRSPIAPITVTSSPRDGWARAPQLSMRAMTAWMSSSVAVGFMTIIICVLLEISWLETVRRVVSPALGPWARAADGDVQSPAERLAKSPAGIRVGRQRGGVECGRASCSASASLQERGQRFQEALVLGLRADRDPQRALAARATSPARTRMPRSARPRMTSASTRSSPRSNQTKLACEAAGSMPSSRSPSSSPMRSARLRSTRLVTSSVWFERLERRGLRGRVAEERLAHLVDRGAEALRAAQRVADAQPAQPVDLAERPQQHEVRVPVEQRDRLIGVLQDVELDVGLVEDHRDVARARLARSPRSRRSAARSRSGCSGCRRSPAAWRR